MVARRWDWPVCRHIAGVSVGWSEQPAPAAGAEQRQDGTPAEGKHIRGCRLASDRILMDNLLSFSNLRNARQIVFRRHPGFMVMLGMTLLLRHHAVSAVDKVS